jgi:hypothetical protein
MTAGESGIAVLLEHSLRCVRRNRKGRRQFAQAISGNRLEYPLRHQSINAFLQGQVTGIYGYDFSHRPAVIRYHHFVPLLNEFQISAEVGLGISDSYAGISH